MKPLITLGFVAAAALTLVGTVAVLAVVAQSAPIPRAPWDHPLPKLSAGDGSVGGPGALDLAIIRIPGATPLRPLVFMRDTRSQDDARHLRDLAGRGPDVIRDFTHRRPDRAVTNEGQRYLDLVRQHAQ